MLPVLALLLFPALAQAQTASSEHFTLQASAIAATTRSPAATATSAGFRLEGLSLGRLSGADASSPAFALRPGYYLGRLFEGILAPAQVRIAATETTVTLSWDPVPGDCEVWSSDNPFSGFSLDESGAFLDSSWTAPHALQKHFYQVRCTP